jgi:phosphohistidine phosphatase
MLTLTLIRHASAVHDNSFNDFNRPLRPKGIDKIQQVAGILNEKGYIPDLVFSSPAVRALQTAEIYAETAAAGHQSGRITAADIITVKSLYLPSSDDILDCLKSLENRFIDVFLFSHNNGISWAAQHFCGNRGLLMPTGSVVRIEFDTDAWSEIQFGTGALVDFIP